MTEDYQGLTPPPELVEQWRNLPEYVSQLRTMSTVTITTERLQHIATQAARWGADQQLELDARWLDHNALNETHLKITPIGDVLKEAMRPTPPSLKEQALAELEILSDYAHGLGCSESAIRRALEALDD
jgi:hypothetical protein